MYGGAEFSRKFERATDGPISSKRHGENLCRRRNIQNVQRSFSFCSRSLQEPNIDIKPGREPRTISVNVVHEVNNPGIITVSALQCTLSTLKSKGITGSG
jgi:hypothetical protein